MPCSSTLHHPAPTGNRRLGTPSERTRPRARRHRCSLQKERLVLPRPCPEGLASVSARCIRPRGRPAPALAVPSYIHIHFRSGRGPGARPLACLHTYIYTSGQAPRRPAAPRRRSPCLHTYIYTSDPAPRRPPARAGVRRAFIHTYTLQVLPSYIHIHFRSGPGSPRIVNAPNLEPRYRYPRY